MNIVTTDDFQEELLVFEDSPERTVTQWCNSALAHQSENGGQNFAASSNLLSKH